MSEYLRPSGRELSVDQAVACDLVDKKFVNYQFKRLVAKSKKFEKCDFSFSEFDASYLRDCVFDSCNFTGCKFLNSNLRGSNFSGCKFDYARFSNTLIDPEILDYGCPGQENLQQEFARSLRINFHQIGDASAANKSIRIELEASRVHFYKAWRSREAYYRRKYFGFKRFGKFLEWARFVALDKFWGNGESPLKLLRSMAVFIVAIGFFDVYFNKDVTVFSNYVSSIIRAPEIFLGIDGGYVFSGVWMSFISAIRYIMFACLVSIIIKRLSRR